MSAIIQEQTLSTISPSNKRRPLSIIEESEDDEAESAGSEQAEKENDEQEIKKEANGHVSEATIPEGEVVKSPSFKALKQFFIDKTESHNNTKNKSIPSEKGPKTKKVEARKKFETPDVAPAHKRLTKTKSPDSPKTTPTSTQSHHTSSTKAMLFLRTSARVAPKTHSVTKPSTTTTTTTASSKKVESKNNPPASSSSSSLSSSSKSSLSLSSSSLSSSTSSLSSSSLSSSTTTATKPTTRPRSSVTAPTAATQAREQAVRLKKSSSFGAVDKLRAKASSSTSTKVTKSNSSVGRTTTTAKKTVAKRDSFGSKEKERKTSKKSDLKQKDKPLDRSFTDSPMSQISETDSVASSSNSVDNATPTESHEPERTNNVPKSDSPSCYTLSSSDTNPQVERVSTQQPPHHGKSPDNNCSSNEPNPQISPQTIPIPQCDSDQSLTVDQPVEPVGEHAITTVNILEEESVKIPSKPEVSISLASPSKQGVAINDSPGHEEKRNINNNNNSNIQNLNYSSDVRRHDDRLQIPLSLSLSSSPPVSVTPPSPQSLSPSVGYIINSPRSPKIMPKFRTSPTLSRRFSIERNNNKSTPLNGKLASLSSMSTSNTFPRSLSRECSGSDLSSMDDSKDYGYILDKSRLTGPVPGSPLIANIYRSARRGSYFFKRKQSNESLNSLSESETLENSCDDASPISASDLNKLKETADRLHLTTRRASILSWRQTYVDGPGLPRVPPDLNGGDATDENLTVERKQKINEALDWLRNELQDMKAQDQTLARQLLTIRQDIHQLKLQQCTEEHQNLLDDFKSELEELEEFSDVLDLPHPIYGDNPLKHIGITRHNMSARRFSAC